MPGFYTLDENGDLTHITGDMNTPDETLQTLGHAINLAAKQAANKWMIGNLLKIIACAHYLSFLEVSRVYSKTNQSIDGTLYVCAYMQTNALPSCDSLPDSIFDDVLTCALSEIHDKWNAQI